jgi:MFS-type transporter involved in bile tolerance (Atg22 family)
VWQITGGFTLAMLGMAAWGAGLGAHKAILKAGIVSMVAPERRGTAYGLYNAAYGVSWFLGSSLMGWLYERSHAALAGVSLAAELAAVPLILVVMRKQHEADSPNLRNGSGPSRSGQTR